MKLLIVEDEPKTRAGLQKLVNRFEPWIQVECAADAFTALQMLDKEDFELFCTDIRMPGLDGLEMLHRMERKNVQCIVISGYADFSYAQQAMREGVQEYLLKPVDPLKFRQAISSAVQKYNESRTKAFRMLCNEQESLWSREAEQLVAQMKMDKFCGVVCWNCRTGELGEDQMDRCRQTVERMREIRQGEILRVVRKNDVIFSVNGASLERCQELCGRVQECTPDFCRFTCLHSPQEQKRLLDVWRNRYHFDFQDSENQSNMVHIVKRYIREHLAENILLGDMAQLVYVHPTYLSKLFKKETQQNLSDYITQCRMERAKQLLKRPEYKIYEVAEACGFQDAKHFALVFKSYVGCTPRQYRNEG